MIKKAFCRMLALIMCIGIFFSVPDFSFASGIDTDSLAEKYNSAPDISEWENYIDTSALEAALKKAAECLEDTSAYTQNDVDDITRELTEAIASLKPHTLGLSLDSTNISAPIGDNGSINAITQPANAADGIVWTSSSPAVQLTECNGSYCAFSIMSYSADPVTITASSNGHSASCIVNVLNPFKSVSLSITPPSAYKTKTAQATAHALGSDGNPSTDKVTWEWTSSNPNIAKIGTTSGKIECVAAGECQITVKGKCGDVTYEASQPFYVNEFIQVQYITPVNYETRNAVTICEGQSFSYSVHVSDSATIKQLSWGSSDTTVMKVTSTEVDDNDESVITGVLHGVKAGTAALTIKATDGSNVTKKVTVTVKPKIKTLKLDKAVLVINPGKQEKLSVTYTPENPYTTLLDWSSSDKSVCTVDYNGEISAHSIGVCNITAKTTDGSDISVVCCVRVANPSASVIISKKKLTMKTGATSSVNATVTTIDGQSYTTKNEVNWKSSDKSIVTVSENGVLSAKKSGSAVITATAKDNSYVKASLTVSVVTSVTGIKLDKSSALLGVGESVTVIPTVSPDDASDKGVIWSSSDTKVAAVDTTGKITAKGMGTATVTCKTSDGGYTAKFTVNVITPVTSITVSPSEVKVYVGASKTLSVTLLPKDATDKSVTYKSSNTKIATVSSSGIVKGIATGSAIITISSTDKHSSAQCLVTVLRKVTAVNVSAEKNCYVGQVTPLGATVSPDDASNKKLTYKSSDTSVATVTEAGYITAKKKGTTAITVKSDDGGYTATCIVTVTPKVKATSFKFDKTQNTLKTGKKFTLNPLFSPSDTSEKGVKYSSDNSLVATVSSTGVVTAKGPGTCNITGISVDGSFKSVCKVTVIQPVKGISFSLDSFALAVGKTLTVKPNISPSNASDKSVKWKSSDTKIAKISSSGKITGVKTGTCVITCTTVDGGYTAKFSVGVYKEVTGIQLGTTKAELASGKHMMLTVKFTPSDATNQRVEWSTSGKAVATVSSQGKVTAKSPGTCVITCKSVDGGYKATCTVTVYRPVKSLSLNYSSVRLDAGKTKTLKVTFLPENATYKTVKWSSSDSAVATVDEKGILTAHSAGTARISVVSKDGYCSAYCTVTVVQPPKKVTVTAKTTQLNVGCATQLKATVSPSKSYNKNVYWSSSDNNIASVSTDGVVTAKKAGKVTIICTTAVGAKKAETEILCKIPPEEMRMVVATATVLLGKSTTLKVAFTPSDTTVKTVNWSSSNTSVVKVDKNGKITAVSIGSATITAKSTDGGLTATCFVTVPRRATGLKLNKTSITVEKGSYAVIKATVLPVDATYDTVTWKSADKSIATVDSNGKVTGRAAGTTTVTAKSRDGGFEKKCKVTVIIAPSSLKLNKTSATVYVGGALSLKATVSPSNTTDKTVKWTSSNTSVATVGSDGRVITKKSGITVITAVSSKKSVKAKCTVTVVIPVTAVKLNKTELNICKGDKASLSAMVLPSNATNKKVSFTSSDKSVVTVGSDGSLTALSIGKAVITCTTQSGKKTAVCTVKVGTAAQSVSLNITSKQINTGSTFTLKPTVLPENTTDKSVTYSSSDTSVATVSEKGVVKAVSAGTAVITVKTVSHAKTAKCTVNVVQPVTKITLSKASYSTTQTLSFTLTAKAEPSNATDKTLRWSSSDEDILIVTQKGVVTATGVGKADIICTDTTGNVKAVCTVTVSKAVAAKIVLSDTALSLSVGDTYYLTGTVYPEVCGQSVTFFTDDSDIVYVSPSGSLIAKKTGTAVICAKSEDGHATATCIVKVDEAVTSE